MKLLTAHFPCQLIQQENTWQIHIPAIVIPIRDVLAAASAVIVVAATIMLSMWVAEVVSVNVLAALGWVLGLVFLALAADSRASRAVLQALTALALILLAWLQFVVAPEWLMASAVLLSPWLACSVFKRLR